MSITVSTADHILMYFATLEKASQGTFIAIWVKAQVKASADSSNKKKRNKTANLLPGNIFCPLR